MSYKKREFIMEAFREIGIAQYEFDLQPEDLQMALRRLDTMMASWNAKGIRIGYPLPSRPNDSDLDEDTQVPDAANEAITTNLAIKLGSAFGRVVQMDTKISALRSYNTLLAKALQTPEQQMPSTMPAGAGNRQWRWTMDPFVRPPCHPVDAGKDSIIELY